MNLEGAAAILKPSCSQATGPLESRRWPETDPSKANEVRSGRRQGATKEYTLTCTEKVCHISTQTFWRALTASLDSFVEIKSAPSVA